MEKLLQLVGTQFLEIWLLPVEASQVWTTNVWTYVLVGQLPAVAAFAQSRTPLAGAHLKPWSLGKWATLWTACVTAINAKNLRCGCRAARRHCICLERLRRTYGEFALQAVWANAIEICIGNNDIEDGYFVVNALYVAPFVEHAFHKACEGASEFFAVRRESNSSDAHHMLSGDVELMYILTATGYIGVTPSNARGWLTVSALCVVSDGSIALVLVVYEQQALQQNVGKATVYLGSSPSSVITMVRSYMFLDAHVDFESDADSDAFADEFVLGFDDAGRLFMDTLQRPSYYDGMRWVHSTLPRLQFPSEMDLLHSLCSRFPPQRILRNIREYIRLASDNGAYTYKDFKCWYGKELGMTRWQEAWPVCPRARKLAAVLARFDFRV